MIPSGPELCDEGCQTFRFPVGLSNMLSVLYYILSVRVTSCKGEKDAQFSDSVCSVQQLDQSADVCSVLLLDVVKTITCCKE